MKNVVKRFGIAVTAVALCAGGAIEAVAGQVPTRADLNAILGAGAMTETFEGYNIASGFDSAEILAGTTTLNSSTVANGQGPGLVIPGFTISDSANLQWNGDGYFDLSTKSVSGGDAPMSISFSSPTTAFGVDLETYTGFPNTVTATVYATDDVTVLGVVSGISIPDPNAVFFGWSDTGGIGQVVFSDATQGFSPVLDNLTFGTASGAVPEPSSIVTAGIAAVFGLGFALRRRRKSSIAA